MSHTGRIILIVSILLVCVALDQWMKSIAVEHIRGAPMRSLLFDTVRIQYAENTGSFLSLGSSLPKNVRFWTFNVFTGIVIFGILAYILVNRQIGPWDTWAYALLVSGGIGNLIDRLSRDGVVVDFMNLGIWKLRTGIFNVADVAIMAGIFMLLSVRIFVRAPTVGETNEEENA